MATEANIHYGNAKEPIYISETLTGLSIGTSLTKVYEFTAPCKGCLDALVSPVWAAAAPTGSAISFSASCVHYETFATGDSTRGNSCCTCAGIQLNEGQKIYFFAKSQSATNQGYVDIRIRFQPML